MEIVKHFFLWIFMIVLFVAAAVVLELFEGSKIMTTEYYGLRNIGLTFVLLMVVYAFLFYPITLLPISLVVHKLVKSLMIKASIYILFGGLVGVYMFHYLYDNFVSGYELNRNSSIIIFAVVGLLYALAENMLHRRMRE